MQRPIQAQKNDVAHSNNKHADNQREDVSYLAGLSKESMKLSIGVRYRTGMIEQRKPSMAANCSVFFKRENRRYEKTRSAVASHNPSK